MSKQLTVHCHGKEIKLDLEKVDRTKLYGYVDTEVVDELGQHCELATLSSDGNTLIGRGGTGLATLSPNGLWRDKPSLRAIDAQGKNLTPVASTFDTPVVLDKTASIDDYLAHNIHLVYKLDVEGDASELVADLRAGTIYTFPFSYRGGLEAQAGFLLLGSDGNLFLAVGTPPAFEFVGLKQAAATVEDDDDADDDEEGGLDFNMM
jgi:hypothetical protein